MLLAAFCQPFGNGFRVGNMQSVFCLHEVRVLILMRTLNRFPLLIDHYEVLVLSVVVAKVSQHSYSGRRLWKEAVGRAQSPRSIACASLLSRDSESMFAEVG
jgi:hypothetical protein